MLSSHYTSHWVYFSMDILLPTQCVRTNSLVYELERGVRYALCIPCDPICVHTFRSVRTEKCFESASGI